MVMFRYLRVVLLHAVIVAVLILPAQAALDSVSLRPDGAVAVSLANGFPLWYQDTNGRKLQLCLDTALTVPPGVVVNPCDYEPPTANPPSFPGNFGAEAIYWMASAPGSYVVNGLTYSALLNLSLEASGVNGAGLNDGNQAVFSRIRVRIQVPVVGTYKVTHPYGSFEYVVTELIPGVRPINQSQDLGIDVAQNFLLAMNDKTGELPEPIPPSTNVGRVNETGATIGPFLEPLAPVADERYLGLPFAPPNPATPTLPVDIFQPVTGSLFATNYFRIELTSSPPHDQFYLNEDDESQILQFDNFQLIGKFFNAAANTAPVAVEDFVATAVGRSVNIDVVSNDRDVIVANVNAHGLNHQAIALADENGPLLNANRMPLLTATRLTTAGGTVRRVSNLASGKSTFLYTPPAGYSGPDSFRYVVQDSGGLISAPAMVNITVEELQVERADYRPRFGKWHLRGLSSDSSDNVVTLYVGPQARLTPGQQVQTPAVSSAARGSLSLRVSDNAIEYRLNIDPLPNSTVTAAHIHVGATGSNGPVIFTLYSSAFGVPFTGTVSGILDNLYLQPQAASGISSFSDAISAILSGQAYVNVHTTAFPAGEVRGQILQSLIGRAPVVDGVWEFRGHSLASPGALPSVNVESSNAGVRRLGSPLRLR